MSPALEDGALLYQVAINGTEREVELANRLADALDALDEAHIQRAHEWASLARYTAPAANDGEVQP